MPEKQQLDNTVSFAAGIGCSTISGLPNSNNNNNEVAVKVAVRVRPLNNREKLHQHQPCVKLSGESNQIVIGKDKLFTFDYVIPPKTTQNELYDHCVKGLVQSLFEGYNATVFAYGQTGSGKTFTISGNKLNNDDEYGIIPRAVHNIFQIISQASPVTSHRSNLNSNNKEYCVKVNFIEIYKEELKDLLDSNEKDLQIREDESGNTMIVGANEVICSTLDEVMACFEAGTLLRHTGSTLMNEQSSRSHSVFTISLEQRWTDPSSKTARDSTALYDLASANNVLNSYYLGAKFHFVDLAGSERVHRTGNVGDRFKESIHINSGLLALGNVISALSSNDTKKKAIHIPYRESKITRILKDSLGGNANTLMICCISPSSCNLDESINALKYASRARYIRNKPIVNMDPQTQRFVAMQSEIQALREELHRQRTTIITATSNLVSNPNHQEDEIKHLETCLQATQSEADHYKKLVKEALVRFKQLAKTENQNSRKLVDEWLNMFESTKNKADFEIEDYAKQRINQLEIQLKQAMDDLKSDEEIFTEKDKELKAAKDTVNELETKLTLANRYLEVSFNKEKEQQELMLQLQIQLDKLMQNKQNNENTFKYNDEDALANDDLSHKPPMGGTNNNTSKFRSKTAPNNHHLDENQTLDKNKNRSVYSSPALFTLERVMQSFRARSQILAETLEENDNVLQRNFNSTFDIETDDLVDEPVIEKNKSEEELDDIDEGAKNFIRKGTFKVKTEPNDAKSIKRPTVTNEGSSSVLSNDKKLRDLSINIKMKEELIKELVANSKFTNRINIQYQHKIESLNKEINQYKNEISELQLQLQNQNQSNLITSRDPSKIETELKKQLEATKSKLNDLESKQRDTQKALNSNSNQDKRIQELELALTKTQQKVDQLQKKIKEESDKKLKLEKDFEKEQQKLKDLENKNEQNQKILKKKTEDLVTAQRRLRSGSNAGLDKIGAPSTATTTGNSSPDVDKHWVEQEMEKLVEEKKQMDLFKEELKRREELVKKKEFLLKEKNDLQMKKLRSSQLTKESLNMIDQKLENINKQINQDSVTPAQSNYKELEETHESLVKQKKKLDEKIQNGTLLTAIEERRLIEIDEAIEALEIAIDFESETINDQHFKLKDSILLNSDPDEICDNVLQKLDKVSYEDTRKLVRKFFQKIIDLKEMEQKKLAEFNEIEVQLDEQTRLVEHLQKALNASSNELDRRLLEHKAKAEKSVKSLTQELHECTTRIASMEKEISLYKEKLARVKNVSGSNKVNGSHFSEADFESGSIISNGSNQVSQATGSFYIDKTQSSEIETASVKSIKVQKKDIRRLTDEELLKRSVKKTADNN